jgi:O-antigen/teichoic acid export membrane protein
MEVEKSVAKLFSGKVVNTLIQFGAVVGFTKALGAGAMGSYFLFQTVIGLVGMAGDLGLSRAAEKRLSANEPAGEVITTVVATKALLLLPWLIGMTFAAQHVDSYVGITGITPFILVGLIINQTERLSLRLLAGQLRVDENAMLRVLGRGVWLAVGLGLVALGWGPTAIIAAFAVGNTTTVLGALVRLDLAVDWPRLTRARSLLNFGQYALVGDIGGFVYQWMDVAVLRLFVPVELVGAYEIAWRVASMSLMLTSAIRTSLFPQISRWHAEDQFEEIESALYRWLQVPLYLTIPAFAGAVVLGREVLGTLFDAQVALAYPVLIIFMLEKILRSVQLIVGPSLFAMDKPDLGYRGSVVGVGVNVVLNFTLIPTFGMVGAAIATTVGAATAACIAIRYVSMFVEIQIPWSRITWAAGSATVMSSVVYLVRLSLSPGWSQVVFGVATGAVCYGLLLMTNEGIRLDMKGMVKAYGGPTN